MRSTPVAGAPIAGARREGERVARSETLAWLARAGFVARAAIYLLIGALAFELAIGEGGGTTDQKGAMERIANASFGELLLIALAIGLGGYALWRIVRALIGHGPDGAQDDTADRIAGLSSGVCYAILCVIAVGVLRGGGGAGAGTNEDSATAGVLGWGIGPVVVAVAGIVLIGVGLYQGYRALSQSFLEDSKTEQMTPQVRRAFTTLGTVGHASRMVVFGLIGYFLLRAGLDYDPDKAIGLDGALAKLAQQDHGAILLGIVAAGLIAFGIYSLADARYRRL